MLDFSPGRLARSLAGHDKDRVYVILSEDGPWLLLSDGRLRPLEKPKKKKKMHVQLMGATPLLEAFREGKAVTNEAVRYAIKHYGGSNVES